MNDQTNRRKRQHIEVIGRDEGVERNGRFFDAMQLQHRAMPEINLHDVDPSIEVMGKRLSFPLLISSMTGGDDVLTRHFFVFTFLCRFFDEISRPLSVCAPPAPTLSVR